MDLFNNNGAIFSPCRKYRYMLWRKWSDKPFVMFIGLNPSTANETEPDRTISKVEKVAAFNNFGGLYMLNLFSIVSSNPKILTTDIDCLKDNDIYLQEYAAKASAIVYCWGVFKENRERAIYVQSLFNNLNPLCFKKTKNGFPWHPLYCLDKTKFIPFL